MYRKKVHVQKKSSCTEKKFVSRQKVHFQTLISFTIIFFSFLCEPEVMNSKTISKYTRIPKLLWDECLKIVVRGSSSAHNVGQESFIPRWVFSFVAQSFLERVFVESNDGLIRAKSHYHPVDILLLFLAWFRSSGSFDDFSFSSAGEKPFSSPTLSTMIPDVSRILINVLSAWVCPREQSEELRAGETAFPEEKFHSHFYNRSELSRVQRATFKGVLQSIQHAYVLDGTGTTVGVSQNFQKKYLSFKTRKSSVTTQVAASHDGRIVWVSSISSPSGKYNDVSMMQFRPSLLKNELGRTTRRGMYFSTRNRLMAGAKMQLPLIEELCKLCCFAGDGQPFERGQMMSILCDGGYNFASEFISVCLFFFFFFNFFFLI